MVRAIQYAAHSAIVLSLLAGPPPALGSRAAPTDHDQARGLGHPLERFGLGGLGFRGSTQSSFEQRVDHFDPLNDRRWQQTFFVNASAVKDASKPFPVLLCMGGEGPPLTPDVVRSSVHCNNALEYSNDIGALVLALEHRYYTCHNTSACPVSASGLTKLVEFKYFSVEQALEDTAAFYRFATHSFKLPLGSRWITFGGSYPGILAGFARLRFPHLFHGAVASSAPVRASVDMPGYNAVVSRAYATASVGGSEKCRAQIAHGHKLIGEKLATEEGRQWIESLFGLERGSLDSTAKQREFCGNGVAQFPAQSNDPVCEQPVCNIAKICQHMATFARGSEVEALADLVKKQTLTKQQTETKALGVLGGDLWIWQVCTEWGFLQTCHVGSECMYTQGLVTVESMFEVCSAFGIKDISQLATSVERTNNRYGGTGMAISNVLWVNGGIDPWIANSPQELTADQARIGQEILLVPGASHHAWTHPSRPDDQQSVKKARKRIRNVVKAWLDQPEALDLAAIVPRYSESSMML